MAKSEGNYFTLGDLLERGYKPLEIRYLLVATPYRRQLNFTFDGLTGARTALERLENFQRRLQETPLHGSGSPAYTEISTRANAAFGEAMDDDLNTAKAIGVLWDFVREVNAALDRDLPLSEGNRTALNGFLGDVQAMLGIIPEYKEASLEEWVEKLITERENARKNRNFARADEIRNELSDKGIILEDTKDGVRWKKG
jgi:cysteinyl-tRNA synthetase